MERDMMKKENGRKKENERKKENNRKKENDRENGRQKSDRKEIGRRKSRSALFLAACLALFLAVSGCLSPNGAGDGAGNGAGGGTNDRAVSGSDRQVGGQSSSLWEILGEPEDFENGKGDILCRIPGINQDIPVYAGEPYVELNENIPLFTAEEMDTDSFETYSDLDLLGRCGAAYACIGLDLMPEEERGAIGQVKPSGWHTVKYDCVDGKYLYNRCHLIGYQLSGENANERNLITGTRYLNVTGMLPFENQVADYVQETGNHVLYRVTPIYGGDNLVAYGVQMEGLSVEDGGEGVSFHVFAYNAQPGIWIDYETGDSCLAEERRDKDSGEGISETASQNETAWEAQQQETPSQEQQEYILNTNTMKFHLPSCDSVSKIQEKNKESFNGPREWLLENGYTPCGICKP